MNETVIYVETGQNKIFAIDVSNDNAYIVYTDNKEVITGDKRLLLDVDIKFPIIRFLGSNKFLLADSRINHKNLNAYIFDFDGNFWQVFLQAMVLKIF